MMKKTVKKTVSYLLIVALSFSVLFASVPNFAEYFLLRAKSVTMPDFEPNLYIASFLADFYSGNGIYPGEQSSSSKKLDFYVKPSNVSAANLLVDEIHDNGQFMAWVAEWEFLTFNPSNIVEDKLDEKGYYSIILLNILDCSFNSTAFIDSQSEMYITNALNWTDAFTDYVKAEFDIDYSAIKNKPWTDLDEVIQGELKTFIEKELGLWEKRNNVVSSLSNVVDVAATVNDYIINSAKNAQLAKLSEDVKAVLYDMYQNCPDGEIAMKTAIYDVYKACGSSFDAFIGNIINGTVEAANTTFKIIVGEMWKDCIFAIEGGFAGGAFIGQAIGKGISNFCFSTDHLVDQYYSLEALVKMEKLIAGTTKRMRLDCLQNQTVEDAKELLTAVDLLCSVYELGCDYSVTLGDIFFTKGLISQIKGMYNDPRYESFTNSTKGIKKIIGEDRIKMLNINSYDIYLEVDYPELYQSLYNKKPSSTPKNPDEGIVIVVNPMEEYYWFDYTLKNNEATITGYHGVYGGSIEIPSIVDGYPVVAIANKVFAGQSSIIDVDIADSVKTIKSNAFENCTNLESVDLGKVEKLGSFVFKGCDSLTEVTIPNTVTSVNYSTPSNGDRNGALAGSNIKRVVFEEGISHIPDYICAGCTTLTSVVLPDKEMSVDGYSIGSYAFERTSIISVDLPENLTEIKDHAFYKCGLLREIDLKSSVSTIGNYAFDGCSNLSVVDLGNVVSIGQGVFEYCPKIISLNIPDSLKEIKNSAFRECTALKNLDLNSVTNIGNNAFQDCVNLESVDLGKVEKLGSFVFKGCDSLTEVTIPNTVTSVNYSTPSNGDRNGALAGSNIKRVVFEEGISNIPDNICAGCTTLTSVVLPNKEMSVDGYSIGSYAFERTSIISVDLPENLTEIKDHAFYKCGLLREIDLKSSVSTIGNYAFDGCSNLSVVDLGNVVSIGQGAFEYCPKIISLNIPDSLKEIKNSAFRECTGLKNLDLNSVTTIGSTVFQDCANLESVDLGEAEKLGSYMFSGCDSLTEITIPNTVINVSYSKTNGDRNGFLAGSNIKRVVFEEGISNIPDNICAGCTTLTSVILPEKEMSVDGYSIGSYAFERTSLTSIDLPENLTEIKQGAFKGCSILNQIGIKAKVKSIGYEALGGCTGLTDVYYSSSESDWEKISVANKNEPLLNAEIHFNSSIPPKTYTVKYCDGNTVIAEYSLSEGMSIPVPANPLKEGYEFVGWDMEIPDVMPAKNLVFRAKWNQLPEPDENVVASGNCGENIEGGWKDNLKWVLYKNGELVVSGSGPMGSMDSGASWSEHKDDIIKVTVNEGATSVGDSAFLNHLNLKSVKLPKTVLTIGGAAFAYSGVTEVVMPGVWTIGMFAFYNSDISDIILPESLVRIEESAFESSELFSITIPSGVSFIGENAFSDCKKLRYIKVDADNKRYYDDGGVLIDIDKKEIVQYPPKRLDDCYVMPASVVSVGALAFENYEGKSILFSENLVSIGYAAFWNSGLESVVISDGVEKIEGMTFNKSEKLKAVTIPVSVTEIGDKAFVSCSAITDVYYSGTEAEWNEIAVGEENENLLNATIHFADDKENEELKTTICIPSISTISYGDSIVLHVDESKIPEGGRVEWTASNGNFSYKANGATCTISPEKSGDTIFTATVYDASGNAVSTDEQTMTSKAGFFQKIIAFFKKLFGLTKTIPQAFKGIF